MEDDKHDRLSFNAGQTVFYNLQIGIFLLVYVIKYHKSCSRGTSTEYIFISSIRVFFSEQSSGGISGGRRKNNLGGGELVKVNIYTL